MVDCSDGTGPDGTMPVGDAKARRGGNTLTLTHFFVFLANQ